MSNAVNNISLHNIMVAKLIVVLSHEISMAVVREGDNWITELDGNKWEKAIGSAIFGECMELDARKTSYSVCGCRRAFSICFEVVRCECVSIFIPFDHFADEGGSDDKSSAPFPLATLPYSEVFVI